jgi:hypothetical protein
MRRRCLLYRLLNLLKRMVVSKGTLEERSLIVLMCDCWRLG